VRTDRAVDAPGDPTAGRIVAGDLLGHGALGAGDPPGGGEPRTSEDAYAHHVVLPLGEVLRIGDEGEDLLRPTPDLDRGD